MALTLLTRLRASEKELAKWEAQQAEAEATIKTSDVEISELEVEARAIETDAKKHRDADAAASKAFEGAGDRAGTWDDTARRQEGAFRN